MEPNASRLGEEEHEELFPPSRTSPSNAGFGWQENDHESLIDWEGGPAAPETQKRENDGESFKSQGQETHEKLEERGGEGNTQLRRAACLICRQLKVRCSRHKPSCERCIRLRRKCVYGVPGIPGRKLIPQALKEVRSRLC